MTENYMLQKISYMSKNLISVLNKKEYIQWTQNKP